MKRVNIMENLTSAISVQVDSHDKELANGILKSLGLNMSTYVNMAIKQLINKDGVPFDVVNPRPTKELIESLNEGETILQEIKTGKRKGYTNMKDLINALNEN